MHWLQEKNFVSFNVYFKLQITVLTNLLVMNIWSLVIPSLFSKVLPIVHWKFSWFASALCFPSSIAAFPSSTLLLTFFMTLGQMVHKSPNFWESSVQESFFWKSFHRSTYSKPLILAIFFLIKTSKENKDSKTFLIINKFSATYSNRKTLF